jgi:succinate-acetate transporter protein
MRAIRWAIAWALAFVGLAALFAGCVTTKLERSDGAQAQCSFTTGAGVLGLLTVPFVAVDHKHCIEKYEADGYTVKQTRPY